MAWERVEIKLRTVHWKNQILVWHHHYQDDTKTFFHSGPTQRNVHKISAFSNLFHLNTVRQLNPANHFPHRYRVVVICDIHVCPEYERRLVSKVSKFINVTKHLANQLLCRKSHKIK